jgi:hypothetical protein
LGKLIIRKSEFWGKKKDHEIGSVGPGIVDRMNPATSPIPSLHHPLGNLGITGFIRIPKIPSVQVHKEEQEAE